MKTIIKIELETFQILREAVSTARNWMAHSGPKTRSANLVRKQLNEAVCICDYEISNLKPF